jgi:hypothetical protein
LRKIFGPVQNEDGSWRIRKNYELNELTENVDIVRFIKSRRIAWLGHVMWMDDKRTPKRISDGNLWVQELEGDQGRDGLQT